MPRSHINNSFNVRPTFALENSRGRNGSRTETREIGKRSEHWSLFLGAAALFVSLSLFTYNPKDPSFNVSTPRSEIANWCGLIGSHLSDALVQLCGTACLAFPAALWAVTVCLYRGRRPSFAPSVFLGGFAVVASLCVLCERFDFLVGGMITVDHAGGALGSFFHASMLKYLGGAGEMLVTPTALIAGLLSLSGVSFRPACEAIGSTVRFIPSLWVKGALRLRSLALRFRRDRSKEDAEERSAVAPAFQAPAPPAALREDAPELHLRECEAEYPDDVWGGYWKRLSVLPECPEPSPAQCDSETKRLSGTGPQVVSAAVEQTEPVYRETSQENAPEPRDTLDIRMETPADYFSSSPEEVIPEAEIIHEESVPPLVIAENERSSDQFSEDDLSGAIEEYLRDAAPMTGCAAPPSPAVPSLPAPPALPALPVPGPALSSTAPETLHAIAVTERADVEVATSWETHRSEAADDYALPPVELLDEVSQVNRNVDSGALTGNAGILERKLSDLGVQASVVAVHPGPVITMYELSLASGVPLRRVMNMADDLAMALKSGSTRVVAPIPGKDTVGVEVPNLNREVVQFREIIESQPFREASGQLKMALGKKIDGQPFATSLLRMPHLLIAGATGTGKSVGLNSLICSWLMSCRPDDVKFLLVDPKKLELSFYQDIPHLLHPVVTDPDKVPAVLGWAIREMERRYDLLSLVGARNIGGYNELLAKGKVPPGPDGAPAEKLPYIVIIVDELAELMMVAAKDIEISIARLAQMARASGIHLILATQRPSVDVITGVIKANFPARLSYQVSAKADSRTILDTVGAEHLLGLGDMLFMPPGTAKLIRLHGAYISENEIRRIVDFVKRQRPPQYLQEISRTMAGEGKPNGGDLGYDEKYDEAVDLVSRLGHASISLIQRHMRIGYNRAARIMETMESEGLVGPSDGTSRPREVLARSLQHVSDQLN